ncbi:hypothetical protein FA13DRAFT_1726219 [Coprinellus micaceus]|uniref:Uncharacterized protein n=1 Tax=Coprinellus micaceus TaxID=71717 RepID=A0A4Y7TSC2_COPMI|nr:hypothetical protein FA13DRAFT_1726219 [Coprinellus micaceus]
MAYPRSSSSVRTTVLRKVLDCVPLGDPLMGEGSRSALEWWSMATPPLRFYTLLRTSKHTYDVVLLCSSKVPASLGGT